MDTHQIHLHGPWECEPLALADKRETSDMSLPQKCTMTIPCRWSEGGLADFQGKVRMRRRFHWPNTLDSRESLWLCFGGVEYFAVVWLNGNKLGEHAGRGSFEFEISSLVQVKNELVVEVDSALVGIPDEKGDFPSGGLWGPVTLEVRPIRMRPLDRAAPR